MPKLSIITVNLNNALGLAKTIESIVNQTFTNYEYIIIDGASSDSSIKVIEEYKNKIKYWISEPDKGIYNAMNKGILQATGEYLQFLNSGDCLTSNTILSEVFSVKRNADIVYGSINGVFKNKNIISRPLDESQISLAYFYKSTIPHPAAFISKKLFDDSKYDESYAIAADKKFFVDKIICQNCTIQRVDEVIVNFDKKGISSRMENNVKRMEENERLFSQLFPPRILVEYDIYRQNYSDILSLVKIKRSQLFYLLFKVIKKITLLFGK